MRVLQIMASCAKVSGVANVVMRYYRQIHDKVAFDFLVYWDVAESYKEEIEELGGRVFVIPQPRITHLPQYIRAFSQFLDEHEGEYLAVHLHEVYLNLAYFPVAKRHGIPLRIAHSHSTQFSDHPVHAIRNRIAIFPVRWTANRFIGCSLESGVAFFGKRICQGQRFSFLKNAIEAEAFAYLPEKRKKLREEFGIMPQQLVVGHVGRFSAEKNHDYLLKVFDLLRKNRDAVLLLIGTGPLFDDVRQKAQMLGISDCVVQTGFRADVKDILSAMDVFVLPSWFEGLPCVLIEAQSNGLPCVVADTISTDSNILPNYRILSLQADPVVWANEIAQSERIWDTEESLSLISKAGYNIEETAQRLLDIYAQ